MKHGMNLQVIASPDGDILSVSGALPGSVHDKNAEWVWESCTSWRPRAWSRWPTRATRGARTRKSRIRGRTSPNPSKTPTAPTRDSAHPARANAQFKTCLRKLRCCPWRAGQLAKAIHVLQIREAKAG